MLDDLLRAALTPVDPSDPDDLDRDLIRGLAEPVDRACRAWFDLDVSGLEHVPEGPALVVGNHNSGITFVEALGLGARWYTGPGREAPPWHGLAHDAMVDLPVVGPLLVRIGAVRAGHDTAAAVFARGRKVVVFPGGNREAFRPWHQRDRIVFGGRTGWVRLALCHRVPIVPVVFEGGQDAFLVLSDNRGLARRLGAKRLLRADTWPLMLALPWGVALGPVFHLPLPVPCQVRMLPPVPVDDLPDDAHDDPAIVAAVYDRVTGAMQEELSRLAAGRRARRRARWRRRASRALKTVREAL